MNYAAPGSDEFFVYLPQKSISSMKFFLTDHKGRPLGRMAGSSSKTASGSGVGQSTTGPMHFTATLRIDTVQRSQPNTLKTNPISRPIAGRNLGPGYVQKEFLHFD